MKKGILSLTVVLSLIASMITALPVMAGSIGYYNEGAWYYGIENGEAEIAYYDEYVSGDLTIPNTLGGYPVTSI